MLKRTNIVVVLLAIAAPVLATTTWTPVTGTPGHVRCVQGWNPTAAGTEPAPVTSTVSSSGLDLTGLESVNVFVETCTTVAGTTCTAGGNMTAGNKLNAYIWSKVTGAWYPVSDGSLDLTVAGVRAQGFPGFALHGDAGRMAWEPTAVGTTTRVLICGTKRYPTNR